MSGLAGVSLVQDYFSPDYATARERFRSAATGAGARLYQLPLRARAPDGNPLTIDIAWLGSRRPDHVLLHSSGLHGIEGFAGSAIQLRLVSEGTVDIPVSAALILMHVMNPFGMAWLRRSNENNVDLNRNFLDPEETWSGSPEGYRTIDPVINPPSPPSRDFFFLRAAWHVFRKGFASMQRIVATGQYDYPDGLFYGGAGPEEGPALTEAWISRHLSSAQLVFAIDVHTGLGRPHGETLFRETRAGCDDPRFLEAALGRHLVEVGKDQDTGYANRGGYGCMLPRQLPQARVDVITQEFGTWSALRVLHALREENRWHFYGNGSLNHQSKRSLREAFCPSSRRWRQMVLDQGAALAASAGRYCFGGVTTAPR